MTSTISPVVQQILPMVRSIMISDEQFATFNQNIDRKLTERAWTAKDANSQPELDTIFLLYKKAIEDHKANMQTQYDLGQKMFSKIETTEDFALIPTFLHEFNVAIQPLLAVHKQLQTVITQLEGRIIPLLPPGTRLTNEIL